ncbi:MAG: class I SAM-dependent methyltransferase [Pyrinomonadaceae bacterium]
MSETIERFSNRVENYVKYRPGYPAEVLRLFKNELGLAEKSVIADVGSGTGLSAKMFLENGNEVFCVEPNNAMRTASEEFLDEHPGFRGVNGTAENTTLPDASIDIVIAAQAFHWFDADRTREEFKRILKPKGYIALIWNERRIDATPFLQEYEQFLLKFASDYTKVRHDNVDEEKLFAFFGQAFNTAVFENAQVLDFDGLKGRVLSSSYMPAEGSGNYSRMTEDLRILFAKYAEIGKIVISYDTNIFYAQL